MADRTSSAERLDRETAADRLNAIASALREGESARVRVGNKNVTLHPPETVGYRIDVIERNKFLRGDRETIEIELEWKPK